MSKPFRIGDRVAVYGAVDSCHEWEALYCRGNRGTVCFIVDKKHEIGIEFDKMEFAGTPSGIVHPKQCRRLRKKAKK